MNSTVQRALDNLEAQLDSILESVASYNPSSTAAVALLAADDELNSALAQLDEHQNNHRRILELRATSAALDDELTGLLTSLSETWQAVQSVPATTFPEVRDVPYDELLSYASKISRFTRPSNPAAFKKLMTQLVPQLEEAPAAAAPPQENGENSAVAKAEDSQPQPQSQPQKKKEVPMGMTEEELHDLDPSSHMPFTPWPSEEVMKQGQIFGVIPEREVEKEEPKAINMVDGVDALPKVEANGAGTNGVKKEEPRREEVISRPPQPRPQPAAPKPLLGLELYDSDEDD